MCAWCRAKEKDVCLKDLNVKGVTVQGYQEWRTSTWRMSAWRIWTWKMSAWRMLGWSDRHARERRLPKRNNKRKRRRDGWLQEKFPSNGCLPRGLIRLQEYTKLMTSQQRTWCWKAPVEKVSARIGVAVEHKCMESKGRLDVRDSFAWRA